VKRLALISDSVERADALKGRLAGFFDTAFLHVDELDSAAPGDLTRIDVSLRDAALLSAGKHWLKRRPANGRAVLGVNAESYHESTQAYAGGATDVFPRALDGHALFRKIFGRPRSIAIDFVDSDNEHFKDISASLSALQNMFVCALGGTAPNMQVLKAATTEIVERIEEEDLARWLDVIRRHHSQTYQHCLIVTGVVVSIGRFLGFNRADKLRLASAGLLHDLGKARIPVDILEKPAPLTDDEMAVMRTHPTLGFEALRDVPGVHPEMLDMVLHHHEYLDGSGYPHRLRGREIADLVRIITIGDIYGALIEQRPYRPPMSGPAAYKILEDMGGKLDRDLVRAFRPLALSVN